jgi:hypothetical protein
MSLVLQSSGGGSVTIAEPTTASNFTQDLPAATGTVALLQTPSFATTIGVGGATPAASGAGITFPASQSASTDANTLDDYEEGSWTPTIEINSSSTGIAYGTQVGRYTKVGNVVTCWFYLGLTNKGSSSGSVTLLGIPFTPSSTSSLFSVYCGTLKNAASSFGSYAQIFPSNSVIAFKKQGSDTDMSNTDLNNNTEFLYTLNYMTA